jgi:hypothetical protein
MKSDEGTGRPCPFCGAIVICVDATRTILHAAPVCEPFAKQLDAFGLKARHAPWLAVRRGEGKPS